MKRGLHGKIRHRGSSSECDSKRPPLVPLGLAETSTRTPGTSSYTSGRSKQGLYFSRSEYSEFPSYGDGSDKFDLMNVTVVIYSLSGLICEKETVTSRSAKFERRGKLSGMKLDLSSSRFAGSTFTSHEPYLPDSSSTMDDAGVPTTAVISYRKNAYSSQTSLETFLPSVPLNRPTDTTGSTCRYQASWPSELSSLEMDDSALARSSFKLTRCMKQGGYVPGSRIGSNYVPETLELRINLSRGTELLRLGTATFVISGDEEGEVQMLIPARGFEQTKKIKRKKIKANPNLYGYFSGDLTRRFFLDENSTLRVGIRVLAQVSTMVPDAKDRNENYVRSMWRHGDFKNAVQTMGIRKIDARQQFYGGSSNTRKTTSFDEPNGLFQSMFCGALCASDSNQRIDGTSSDIPRVVRTADLTPIGVGSLMSSVSESTDGSDESESDIEAEMSNFRMASVLRRFT